MAAGPPASVAGVQETPTGYATSASAVPVAATGETPASFTGAVLAGGASRRMGRDKAFVAVDGSPLVERSLAALAAAGAAEMFVVGGDRDRLRARGHRTVDDDHPRQGPLGAIATALGHARHRLVVVLACDLLAPSPRAIGTLLEGLGSHQVAVAHVEGHDQWLHAVWRREAVGVLRRVFDGGARGPSAVAPHLDVVRIVGVDPAWFRDADSPADLVDGDPDGPGAAGRRHPG